MRLGEVPQLAGANDQAAIESRRLGSLDHVFVTPCAAEFAQSCSRMAGQCEGEQEWGLRAICCAIVSAGCRAPSRLVGKCQCPRACMFRLPAADKSATGHHWRLDTDAGKWQRIQGNLCRLQGCKHLPGPHLLPPGLFSCCAAVAEPSPEHQQRFWCGWDTMCRRLLGGSPKDFSKPFISLSAVQAPAGVGYSSVAWVL